MTDEHWTVAYRKRIGEATLIDDTERVFTAIPNTRRYWFADPFVFTKDGKSYIFAEMYDKILFKGTVGYCELTDSGPGEWKKIITEPHHLSYPFIFEHADQIYMIPESYVANEISLYKAVGFPDKWVKVKALVSDYCAVDSTVFKYGDRSYMLTMSNSVLKLFEFDTSTEIPSASDISVSINDPEQNRPAGKTFRLGDRLIRPAQDCSNGYGYALNFYSILSVSQNEYKEEPIAKIYPSQIRSTVSFKPEGIHTYSIDENYEVIDLKTYKKVKLPFVRRVYRAILWRVSKVLGV